MGDGLLLEMRGMRKSFPGVQALDDCSFSLKAGEVHALVGENGAGKSTLMKLLSGVYKKDGGEILLRGHPVELRGTSDAQRLGISIIHQEINLMQHLSVSDNIWIGREPMRGWFLDRKEQNRRTEALLDALQLHDIQPTTVVSTLTVAKQQMVEIAKALSFESACILIMDEPTAALTDSEIEDLFRFIRKLKADGVGIIYISHRMEELKAICDRVTVMRDGKTIGTRDMEQVSLDEIIAMMVGRTIYEEPKACSAVPESAPVVLEAVDLVSPDVHHVSFSLKKGEILGMAGLMGAGRTETARLICGADRLISGEIRIHGKPVRIKTPHDAVQAGIGYLSEDRKRYGLCLGMSVADNVALANLERLSAGPFIRGRAMEQAARQYIETIRIKTPGTATPVRSLSGGNQQKVVMAKWLERDCDILIFDEPTRGIDVGAKSEIYRLMKELAAQGKSILMISSELPELLRMSDRIMVMCEGRKTGELRIEDATQEKIMALATKQQEEA